MIQSFAPGEVTPEQAMQIGEELCDRYLKGDYQYVIAVHHDKSHLHCHIIFNNTNLYNGLSFTTEHNQGRKSERAWAELREISDEICAEHGISVISEPEKGHGVSHFERNMQKEGKSWKDKLRVRIAEVMLYSRDFKDFLEKCSECSIEYVYKPSNKVKLKFRLSGDGQQKFTRADTLGADFTPERIAEQIAEIQEKLSAANVTPDMLQSLPPVVRQFAITPKLVSSVAHAYRRPHVMSEVSAHAQGGKVTHDQMYGSLCAQYAMGVDTFTYYYGTDFMQTDTYAQYNSALGRIDETMTGTPAPEVFVYYPIETFQMHHKPSAAQYGSYTPEEYAAEAELGTVMDGLLDRQCDFDFIGYDVLAASDVHDGHLVTPAGVSAQALILPPMDITSDMAALFSRLASAGLNILTVPDKDGLFKPAPGARICTDAASLADALNTDALAVRTEVPTPGVLVMTRQTAAGRAVLVCNTCEDAVTLTLSLSGFRLPEVYDPMADASLPFTPTYEQERHVLRLSLPAFRTFAVREKGGNR